MHQFQGLDTLADSKFVYPAQGFQWWSGKGSGTPTLADQEPHELQNNISKFNGSYSNLRFYKLWTCIYSFNTNKKQLLSNGIYLSIIYSHNAWVVINVEERTTLLTIQNPYYVAEICWWLPTSSATIGSLARSYWSRAYKTKVRIAKRGKGAGSCFHVGMVTIS